MVSSIRKPPLLLLLLLSFLYTLPLVLLYLAGTATTTNALPVVQLVAATGRVANTSGGSRRNHVCLLTASSGVARG